MGMLRTIHRRLVAECVAACTGPAAGSNGATRPAGTASPGTTASASSSTVAANPAGTATSTACGLLPATGTDGYLPAAAGGYLPAATGDHLRQSGISGTACDLCSRLSFVGCPGNGRDQCGFKDHL